MVTRLDVDNTLLQKIDDLQLSERLYQLKDAMFSAPRIISADRARLAMESWQETEGEDIELRRAKLFQKVLEGVPIAIYDFDIVVGRETEHLTGGPVFVDETGDCIPGLWDEGDSLSRAMVFQAKEDKDVLRECSRFFAGKTAPDHVKNAWYSITGTWAQDISDAKGADPTPDSGYFPGITNRGMWEKILSRGMRGMIEEAEAGLQRFREMKETDINKLHFWQSAIIVCEAMIHYARRYAELARRQAEEESDLERRNELIGIAEICEYVPENPARTFHEALQCMNFIMVGRGLEAMYPLLVGRIDQYLRPYFENDLREGRLTLERAAELLGSVLTLWGMKVVVPVGQTQQETHQFSYSINSINIGGVDRDGKDASNALSYLLLHMIGLIRLSSPTVLLNWNSQTPRWLLLKALETNVKTKGGIPLFENSDHVVASFVNDGTPVEVARDWYGQGCVTPILPTKVDHNGSEGKGAVNVALIMDLTLHRGVSQITGKKVGIDVGDPRDFSTFEDLYEAFKKQYKFVVNRVLWLGTLAQSIEPKYLRFPFNSCITGPRCMEEGHDILITDADHSYGISDRAIVDTADSLTAIRELVFDEKKLTMDELVNALDTNFSGERGEEIRQMCLAAPKFGNDIDEADLMVRDVGQFSGSVIMSYINPFDVPCKISREGLSWHYFGGLGVGALPNGRKSKDPLNDGSISPMRGMDKLGPTGVIRSVLKAGFKESYASCLNQKFSGTVMQSPESRGKLGTLIDTFFKNGGQHIQFNMVDTEELLDAKAHPEKHRDLVVRVGGFSAYFVMLSPEIQDDIIYRSTQGC
ncbi:MAG: pyruvate formate lyase family protein [Dehalococcoidia bacterium]|jgi:formate C-acetyltransferase